MTNIDYLIIPLNEADNEIINQLNLFQITKHTSVYCCSLNLICKLLQHEQYPIKNKRKAIENVLRFLKWVDSSLGKNEELPKTCLPIGRDIFESFFSRNEYNEYIALLKELEVMCLVPYKDGKYFKQGVRNNLFRFYSDYMTAEPAILITDQANYGTFTIEGKHPKKLIETIKKIQVDFQKAIDAEIQHYKDKKVDKNQFRIRLSKLFSLNGNRFVKYGNKVNRVYHSLSNLSKISRKHLHINGATFNNIDVVNCQPLLFCYYLIKHNLPIDPEYIAICEAGKFYEQFYTPTGDEEIDEPIRKAIKQQLYKCVFFDFKTSRRINKKFGSLYPKTHSSLYKLDQNEESLAAILQNTEAEIFNGLEPAASKCYFTLFDAIYFTDLADLLPLKQTIKQKFAAKGLKVKTKINDKGEDDIIDESCTEI